LSDRKAKAIAQIKDRYNKTAAGVSVDIEGLKEALRRGVQRRPVKKYAALNEGEGAQPRTEL
jgi:hypothetical protein